MNTLSQVTSQEPAPLLIRHATPVDLLAIQQIYNFAVTQSNVTMDTLPKNADEILAWYHQHDARHPIVVGEVAGKIRGVAYLSKWSERLGYAHTAEASIYLHPHYLRNKYGLQFLDWLINAGKAAHLFTLISIITSGNLNAEKLILKRNFIKRGTLFDVGYKFGKLWDLEVYQLSLREKEVPS